jgi:hypothetical protein
MLNKQRVVLCSSCFKDYQKRLQHRTKMFLLKKEAPHQFQYHVTLNLNIQKESKQVNDVVEKEPVIEVLVEKFYLPIAASDRAK